MNSQKTVSRRAVVKGTLIAGALVPVAALLRSMPAIAAATPLDPADPTAKSLGYVTKTAKPGQICTGCVQFVGKPGDATGGCNIFPGKTVAGQGWCMSYMKKPGT